VAHFVIAQEDCAIVLTKAGGRAQTSVIDQPGVKCLRVVGKNEVFIPKCGKNVWMLMKILNITVKNQ
jgi:hypothetical protein